MAFTSTPLATRPATGLRPRRNLELTPTPYADMSRVFEDVLTAITRLPFTAISPPKLAMARTEVSETDKDISIVAELPGVSQQDVEVSLDDDVLTIRAETRGESTSDGDGQRDYSVMEREYGRMVRAFQLPFSPDPNQVDAQLQDGLLTIRIAKPQSVQDKTHKIEVRGGANGQAKGQPNGQPNAAAPTDGGGAGEKEKTASQGQNRSAKISQEAEAAH
ncbi:MAG: heat shock protein-like protein [Gammaproteobacteria bacterium]|nr:heat shock protein-like protein [Gammaproteobacteria bacterium]